MKYIQNIGLILFIIGLAIFTWVPTTGEYTLSTDHLNISNDHHKNELINVATGAGALNQTYSSNTAFIKAFKSILKETQQNLKQAPVPDGVNDWEFNLSDYNVKEYTFANVKAANQGYFAQNINLFWWLTFGLGILGGLLFIIPKFFEPAGIKNDNIYHNPMTSGLKLNTRSFFIISTILAVLIYGYYYGGNNFFWPAVSSIAILITIFLVLFKEKQIQKSPPRSASPNLVAWLGIFTGIYLIGFYILLYWKPEYMTNWVLLVDPISKKISGNPASQWFLYGFMYTIIVFVMGLRMIAKYRHNKYQIIRTISVIFFQTIFAFLLPEILIKLNQPWYDFKNIWPLNYTFFFDYNLNTLINSGGLGLFMLFWGLLLMIVGVPLFTYFYGKRWYCSWVCGCGGLAETLGDPYRQLSDKSLRAWKYERYIIHGVLAFAIVMTLMVLYSYFTGNKNIFIFNSDTVRTWYGFLIGSAFAGIVGTGFYPLMGNRSWCRFGCVRSSCVGCGVCSAVCPRGVLKLENGSDDVSTRAAAQRVIHISENDIKILG